MRSFRYGRPNRTRLACPMLDRNGVSAGDLKLVTVFVLERHSSARRRAVCERWTHPHGWELRLLINQQLARCTVCYSETECTDTAEAWRQEMVNSGWAVSNI
jgi:hypothetical protein